MTHPESHCSQVAELGFEPIEPKSGRHEHGVQVCVCEKGGKTNQGNFSLVTIYLTLNMSNLNIRTLTLTSTLLPAAQGLEYMVSLCKY